MKLQKSEEKRKCEMGNCKNKASYAIKLERMGIKSVLYVCENCLRDLYKLIGEEIVPKSIETLRLRGAQSTKGV
jgi:hypothetical protein